MSGPRWVWALVGGGLLAFGFSPIFVRLAGDVPALALATWRTTVTALVLAPVALLGPARREVLGLGWRDLGLVLGAGVFLGLHFMAWIGSVQLTSVASASVLVTLSPLMIAALGAVFLSERPTRRVVLAMAVAVVGATLIGIGEGGGGAYPNPALGNAVALFAAFLVAVYLLIGRSVRQRASFVAYFAPLNAAAAATCAVGCVLLGVPLQLPAEAVPWALALGLAPGLIGHGSLSYAVRFVPAATLGLAVLLEPVLATGLALVLFGEAPSLVTILGMAVVLASLAALAVRRRSG